MSASSSWSHAAFSVDTLCQGDGLLVDGTVVATRMHSMFLSGAAVKNVANQEKNLPSRFIVVVVDLVQAHKRSIAANGLELNYKQNVAGSRKYVPLTLLNADELAKLVGDGAALPAQLFDDGKAAVHPATPNRFEMWIDASAPGAKDIVDVGMGQTYRFLTRGSSVFVERHESLTGTANIFKGGAAKDLSASWTKGVAAAAATTSAAVAHEQKEGVDESEWD